jgi:hypothetical protein
MHGYIHMSSAVAAAAAPAHAVHVEELVGTQVLLPQRLTQQPARNMNSILLKS